MLRNMNTHIDNIEKFVAELSASKIPYVLLKPLPKPQVQVGGTCGYYALSIITYYWNSVHSSYPAFPARKCDTPSRNQSLRFFGKKYRKHIDGIYDMEVFKKILNEIGYDGEIYQFGSMDELSNILKESINKGIPIILPVDNADHPRAVSESNGDRAHHVVLVGYAEESGQLYGFLTSHNNYYLVSIDKLFSSCNNLKIKNSDVDVSADKQDGLKIIYMPTVTLEGLRNHLISIKPKTLVKESSLSDKPRMSSMICTKSNKFENTLSIWKTRQCEMDTAIPTVREVPLSNSDAVSQAKIFWQNRCK